MKKNLIAFLMSVSFIFSVMPTVSADNMSMGNLPQIKWNDESIARNQWGTLTTDDILYRKNEGSDIRKIVSNKTFSKFKFLRGRDFYSGTSYGTTFFYTNDSSSNLAGPQITEDGKYFCGVYNPDNNKQTYQVDFAADFDSEMKALIAKGDIEMLLIANTICATDYIKVGKETAVASIRTYNDDPPIQREFKTDTGKHSGYRATNTGWNTLPADTTRVIVDLKSIRDGILEDKSRSMLYYITVCLRDKNGPSIVDAGIRNKDTWLTDTNIAGNTVKTKTIGDTIDYYVTYDEKVKINYPQDLKLELKGTNNHNYYADFVGTDDSKTLYFSYKIPDNTPYINPIVSDDTNNVTYLQTPDESLNVYGTPIRITGGIIKDAAGNYDSNRSVASKFNNTTYTIDDTNTGISLKCYTDDPIYPIKYDDWSKEEFNVYGSFPESLKGEAPTGGSGNKNLQPTVFGLSPKHNPIYRIILDDEIKRTSLTKDTKLKLQVYLDKKFRDEGQYVYAKLVAARVNGIDKNTPANGVKSSGTTELFFEYEPKKIPGFYGDLYYLDIAGKYILDVAGVKSLNGFKFDDDVITTGDSKLINISGNEVSGKNMFFPLNYDEVSPTNSLVTIDMTPPHVDSNFANSDVWTKKINNNFALSLYDQGGFSEDGAVISLVQKDSSGKRIKVPFSYPNMGAATEQTVPIKSFESYGSYSGKIDLSNITLANEVTDDGKIYIEYKLSDKAGNVASNEGLYNMYVHIDNSAPIVTGVSHEVNKNTAKVKYDVVDSGSGQISPQIFYTVQNIGKNTTSEREQVQFSDDQTVSLTGNQGEKDTWRINAKFSDIVGNIMKDYFPSDNIDIATRTFSLAFKDTAASVVSDKHEIKIDPVKLADDDFTLKFHYKWVKGIGNSSAVPYKEIEFNKKSSLININFADEKMQKEFNNGELFSGEYTLFAYAEMSPDNATQFLSSTYYFDTKNPEAEINVVGSNNSEGSNKSYNFTYNISDDGGNYRGGNYTKDSNLDISGEEASFYKLLIDGNVVETYPISTPNGGKTFNIYDDYHNKADYANAKTAKIILTVKDKFGHSTTVESEDLAIDFQAPEITSFVAEGENLLKVTDSLYIVNDLNDIKKITAVIKDNTTDKMNVSYLQCFQKRNVTLTEMLAEKTLVIEDLLCNDFIQTSINGVWGYKYSLTVADRSENSDSETIYFLLDSQAPIVSFENIDNLTEYTDAASISLKANYSTDPYEKIDDIAIEVTGAEITDKSVLGTISLLATQNGPVTVKTTDKMGKTSEKTIEINCFDRDAPTVELSQHTQYPEIGDSKYGEIFIKTSDNVALNELSIAIVTDEPNETDFFTDMAGSRRVATGTDDKGNTVYTNLPYGYFGDETGYAYARLEKINNTDASAQAEDNYKLTYRALPEGTYTLYGKISDTAGNEKTASICEIHASGKAAEVLESKYIPSSDQVTGGSVTMIAKTDIPTMVQYDVDTKGNIAAMQANIRKVRERGFVYNYNGEQKNIKSFEDIKAKYSEIEKKYNEDPSALTEEDRIIFRNLSRVNYLSPYTEFLSGDSLDAFTVPAGDILDYLLNEAYYGYSVDSVYNSSTGYYNYYTFNPSLVRNLNVDTTISDGIDWYEDIAEPLTLADLVDKEVIGDKIVLGAIDMLNYPNKFDEIVCGEFDAMMLTPEESFGYLNPFYKKQSISSDDIYDFFGSGFDTSMLEQDPYEPGMYYNPFDYQSMAIEETDLINSNYNIEFFTPVKIYWNPFASSNRLFTQEEIEKIIFAIQTLQQMRSKSAELIAEKYVKKYMSIDNTGYNKDHILKYNFNTNETLNLLDMQGRISTLPVEITWIDPSVPHIPSENTSFTVNGLTVSGYTNASDGTVTLSVPDTGIYNEYYLTNIGKEFAGTAVDVAGYTDTKLYKSVTINVTDNEIIEFDVINPTVIGDSEKSYVGHQAFVVSQFDREAPTANVSYNPSKPSGAGRNAVNDNVTVTLQDVADNINGYSNLLINTLQHTFTENGSFTFTITDRTGNTAEIPVTVDYIDKTPVDFEVTFTCNKMDITSSFTKSTDTTDYKKTLTNFVYTGNYLSAPVEAQIYVGKKLVKTMEVDVNTTDLSYEYTSNSGSVGQMKIDGLKFDNEPIYAQTQFNYVKPGNGAKSYVDVIITLSDNIDTSFSEANLLSIIGKTDDGVQLKASDVVFSENTAKIRFPGNGFASIVFVDSALNATIVPVSVTTIDKTLPRAFIQYSTKLPTNQNVVATITLDEPVDYMIYGERNTIVKDYSNTYTSFINYEFTENKSLSFKFRDDDGNETEGLFAAVGNIDKNVPKLTATVIPNKSVDIEGKLVDYYGAATIQLQCTSEGDIFNGNNNDTVFLTNASQTIYHTVMENKRYNFTYRDTAGNFDTLYVDVNSIDRTAPTATVTGNPTAWTNQAPEITVTSNPKPNGSPSYVVINGKRDTTYKFSPTENGTYAFLLEDESGNSSTQKVYVNYVDMVPPTIYYAGNRDLYIQPGKFDKTSFEAMTVADNKNGSGISPAGIEIDYRSFDENKPGQYTVLVTASDNAENTTAFTRNINVLGPDDVFAVINGNVLVPNEQSDFIYGTELELSFLNADKSGDKVSYAFEKGCFKAAEMKGTSFKHLSDANGKIKLNPKELGTYTLFLQTENRKMLTMYVFISGSKN